MAFASKISFEFWAFPKLQEWLHVNSLSNDCLLTSDSFQM